MKNLKIKLKKKPNNFEIKENYPYSKKKLNDYLIEQIFYELDTSEQLLKNFKLL